MQTIGKLARHQVSAFRILGRFKLCCTSTALRATCCGIRYCLVVGNIMTTAGPASNGMEAAIMHSMDRELSVRMASSDLGVPAISMASGSHSTTASWRKALDNVVPACVVLK